jgi:hypothetical protein
MDTPDPRHDGELVTEALRVQHPATVELGRVPLQLRHLRFRVCADRTVHSPLLASFVEPGSAKRAVDRLRRQKLISLRVVEYPIEGFARRATSSR